MTDEKKNEIMASSIVAAVKNHKICNMTQLAVSMGLLKKGQSVSGSFGKKVKSLVPDIADLFKANGEMDKGKETAGVKEKKPIKPTKEPKTPKTSKAEKVAKEPKTPKTSATSPGLYPRHAQNPFRQNSGYALLFDVLTGYPDGVRRDELISKYSQISGKDLKRSGFDAAVVLSAKESNTGMRHKSCRDGFWIKKDGDNLLLVLD